MENRPRTYVLALLTLIVVFVAASIALTAIMSNARDDSRDRARYDVCGAELHDC